MSYHVYHTRGFVLESRSVGEADRLIFAFTENMGLLVFVAKASRKISSKLRYSLQEYSFARFAFVRGKNVWRLVDASEILSFHPIRDARKFQTIVGSFSLISRLVHGEGENNEIFYTLENLFDFFQEEDLSNEEKLLVETLATVKLLSALGYMGENETLKPFLSEPFSKSLLNAFMPHRQEALREGHRALFESQL